MSTTCPACGYENQKTESLLGSLGCREHHRCRKCGAEYSHGSALIRRKKPESECLLWHVVTPDWLPLTAPAGPTLDALQRVIGGTRGYGAPYAAGQYLRVRTQRVRIESNIAYIVGSSKP